METRRYWLAQKPWLSSWIGLIEPKNERNCRYSFIKTAIVRLIAPSRTLAGFEPRWRNWWTIPTAGMRASSSTRKPRGTRLGTVTVPVVAWLPQPCRHGEAGLELFELSGAAPTPYPSQSGSPTRSLFPLGRIDSVARSKPCIERWRNGCATKRSSGGYR